MLFFFSLQYNYHWSLCSCVLKALKYEKQKAVSRIANLTEGSDNIFDTKTLNLAVLIFSPCVFNLLLRIVEGGSTLSNKFGLCCRLSNYQLVTHTICSHLATS